MLELELANETTRKRVEQATLTRDRLNVALPKATASLYILPAGPFEPSQIRSSEGSAHLIGRMFHP
ncbi:hypothetical protein VD0002_g1812 [Verticillium dahliae]|uniref:Uncharacterized protein n=1 Tax=Verticillium dahliae TaxID=27337 RepID=A0A2J8DBF4_VERDA|nr:hypothetical protein VdG2_09193 [Verticillium dahliae VDG2]KAF3359065.1 Carbonic anhydrase [Verticillium dahliae VDG1]PNH28065.1 hypothetical protein BJF96_g8683 [Verticillium dahliae]PNH46585.1 hypothetical protein VD0004_g1542 [Verticillium dahliae]PNH54122.1 hypothetical protein VD0003_g3363 [Verticillium dahliae]